MQGGCQLSQFADNLRECRGGTLFPNAKLAEDHVEQVFARGFAHYLAHGIDGNVQIQRDEFERLAGLEALHRSQRGSTAARQSILVTRVDHRRQHFGVELAGPHHPANRIFKRFNAFTGQARNTNGISIAGCESFRRTW